MPERFSDEHITELQRQQRIRFLEENQDLLAIGRDHAVEYYQRQQSDTSPDDLARFVDERMQADFDFAKGIILLEEFDRLVTANGPGLDAFRWYRSDRDWFHDTDRPDQLSEDDMADG